MTNKYKYFFKLNFVEVNRLFVYPNQDTDSKRFENRKYYLPKATIKKYNVIINGRN